MESPKVLWAFVLVVVAAAGVWLYMHQEALAPARNGDASADAQHAGQGHLPQTVRDAALNIDGVVIQLVDGVARVPAAPGSATMATTRYFGNEAEGDLNGDGMNDTAFLITHDAGGSGTFYYVVVGLKTQAGYLTTNAILLGDRIAPQATMIHTGTPNPVVVVAYADRKKNEPMTQQPSVGVSRTFRVVHGGLEEVTH